MEGKMEAVFIKVSRISWMIDAFYLASLTGIKLRPLMSLLDDLQCIIFSLFSGHRVSL
jgi:hypothetical protein